MKKLLWIVLSLLVVAVVGVLIARQVAIGYLTPDFLVKKIESQWNCRAHVDSLDVSLLGTTTVKLEEVALAPRDEYADKGIPLADRPALGKSLIASESVLLEITTADLLARRLNIQQLLVGDTRIEGVIARNGKSDLETMFDRPSVVTAVATEEGVAEVIEAPPSLAGGETVEQEVAAPGGEIALATVADRIQLTRADVSLLFEASDARLEFNNLQIGLSDISIDPNGLDTKNTAAFSFETDLAVKNTKLTEEFLLSHISGTGKIIPFDAATGQIKPEFEVDITLHKGAQINTFPVVERMNELLENVEADGIDLGDFQLQGELLADASTRLTSVNSKITFEQPLELVLTDTTLLLKERNWINTATNTHKLKGTIIASERLTLDIQDKLKLYMKEKVPNLPTDSIVELVLQPVKREGLLAFDFSSTGDMRNPDADVVTPFGNFSDVMEGGKKVIKDIQGVLKGLFGN